MIDLYYRPGAASLVVHAALEEAGAEYNLIRATRENGVFGPREAARLNPDGRVPTMSFDGLAMTESAACLMHISDLYPAADLAPAPGTPARGLWYRWLVYLVNPVQSTFYGFIARHVPPQLMPRRRSRRTRPRLSTATGPRSTTISPSAARIYSGSDSRAPTCFCSC